MNDYVDNRTMLVSHCIDNKTKIFTPIFSIPLSTIGALTFSNKLFGTEKLDNKSLFYNLILNGVAVGVNSTLNDKKSIVYYIGAVSGAYNSWFIYNNDVSVNKTAYAIAVGISGFLIASSLSSELIDLICGHQGYDDAKTVFKKQPVELHHPQYDNIQLKQKDLIVRAQEKKMAQDAGYQKVFSAIM